MKWINYNHLYYFWVVARRGSVVGAAEELMVSQPTVSAQVRDLEASLGQRLFDRVGRGLALTDAGRIAFNHADDMFSTAREMLHALEHQPGGRSLKLDVGIVDVVPKLVARRILERALQLPQSVRLVCREDKRDRLLADLAARRTDVVLSDGPSTGVQIRAHDHALGESGVSFFAVPKLASKYRKGFPKSLDGAPLLLPTDHTQVRHSLNLWFDAHRIHPSVVAEFDDSATMFAFGQSGAGIFPAPTVVEPEVRDEVRVSVVGRAPRVRERFYAVSLEENPTHPAVAAICKRQAISARRHDA